jgi:hypothetical protein
MKLSSTERNGNVEKTGRRACCQNIGSQRRGKQGANFTNFLYELLFPMKLIFCTFCQNWRIVDLKFFGNSTPGVNPTKLVSL